MRLLLLTNFLKKFTIGALFGDIVNCCPDKNVLLVYYA